MAPQSQQQWRVKGQAKDFSNLVYTKDAPIPAIGDHDVLVKFGGASLNYRDLVISKGSYPFPQEDNVVPGSDGAGVVEAIGSKVHRFKKGDKVITLFNQGHIAGSVDQYSVATGTGGVIDGSFQQYGAYNEEGLVLAPSHLNAIEASTLTCAALTAWNALYGLKSLKPGDWVLTQGTGGVSIFAIQVGFFFEYIFPTSLHLTPSLSTMPSLPRPRVPV